MSWWDDLMKDLTRNALVPPPNPNTMPPNPNTMPPNPLQLYANVYQNYNNQLQQQGLGSGVLLGQTGTAQGLSGTNQISANQYQMQAFQQQQTAAQAQAARPTYRPFRYLDEASMEHEAFNTPVETLVNLWLAKYGDAWVDKNDVVDEEFFNFAAQRLIKLGKMEEFYIADSGRTVLMVLG